MKKQTVDILQFVTLVVGVWLGVVPIILKIIGSTQKGVFLPLWLPGPAAVVVAALIVVAALVTMFALDRQRPRVRS